MAYAVSFIHASECLLDPCVEIPAPLSHARVVVLFHSSAAAPTMAASSPPRTFPGITASLLGMVVLWAVAEEEAVRLATNEEEMLEMRLLMLLDALDAELALAEEELELALALVLSLDMDIDADIDSEAELELALAETLDLDAEDAVDAVDAEDAELLLLAEMEELAALAVDAAREAVLVAP